MSEFKFYNFEHNLAGILQLTIERISEDTFLIKDAEGKHMREIRIEVGQSFTVSQPLEISTG